MRTLFAICSISFCLVFLLLITPVPAHAKNLQGTLQDPEVVIARNLIQKLERQNPYPAAEGQCTTGWKYLALLGDPTAIATLQKKAASDAKSAFCAQDALLLALGKPECDRLLEMAAAEDLPMTKRSRALILCSQFARAQLDEMPWQLDKLCCDRLKGRDGHLYLDTLRTLATYQCSLQTAEYLREYLTACLADSSRQPSLPVDECLMLYAVQALDKSPVHKAPETQVLFEKLMRNASWTSVKSEAARALANAGQVEMARDYFRKLQGSTKDEKDRIAIAYDLVLTGDQSARDIIKKALSSSDATIQSLACYNLIALGEDSFVEEVISNINVPKDHYETVALDISDLINCKTATPAQKKAGGSFLASLYKLRTEDTVRNNALSALMMCADEFLQPVYETCLHSLKAPLPEAPKGMDKQDKATTDTFMRHVFDTIVVMRIGKPTDQQAALQRFRDLYMQASAVMKMDLLRAMQFSKYPEARSFLAGIILDPPETGREQCMLFAANTILATSVGQVCN